MNVEQITQWMAYTGLEPVIFKQDKWYSPDVRRANSWLDNRQGYNNTPLQPRWAVDPLGRLEQTFTRLR